VTANLSANSFPRVDWPVGALRVRHRHNTHARTRHTSKRKENGKTKSTSAGGGGEDQKKKKRNHPEMKFFYFFLLSSFSYPGEKNPPKKLFKGFMERVRIFSRKKI
jgi:hypothetical protein